MRVNISGPQIFDAFLNEDLLFDSWLPCTRKDDHIYMTEQISQILRPDTDSICAMAQSGIPIGAYVASRLRKPLYIISHKRDYVDTRGNAIHILPTRPNAGKMALLDSHLKTGTTLSKAVAILNDCNILPQAVVALKFDLPCWRIRSHDMVDAIGLFTIKGDEIWLANRLRIAKHAIAGRLKETRFWERTLEIPSEIPDPVPIPKAFEARIVDGGIRKSLWRYMRNTAGYGPYSLFLDPRRLSECLIAAAEALPHTFDVLVVTSIHGMPFAVWFMQLLHERKKDVALYYLSPTAGKLRVPPVAERLMGKHVLIFDAYFRTGGHVHYAYNILNRCGVTIDGAFCILDYDDTGDRARALEVHENGIPFFTLANTTFVNQGQLV